MKTLIMKTIGLYLNTLALVSPGRAARKGFYLFCYPFRSPVNERHRAFLNTADQSDFEFKGTRIHTYRWGNGPKKVLFLHGWQSHSYHWKRYVDTLDRNEYTLYAFDAPGHGLSGGKYLTVPIYSEVINNFIRDIGGVETIICHSVGSFSAVYALHQNPDLPAAKLVTLAAPGEVSEFFDFYQNVLGLSSRSRRLISEYFNKKIGVPVNHFSMQAFATSLRLPGLIIHDEDDRDTSVNHSRQLHNVWERSRIIVTKGLGHNLKSDDVVKAVASFLTEPVATHA